jgi:Arc/MetJ-type ribon-helix-helix transcriptional regulator
MDEKKEKEPDDEEEDDECISMCCHNGEHEGHEAFAKKIHKKILLKLDDELEGRGNVVMTRLGDEDLKQIDALVEVEAFQSRSEAAAFFIKEGIQARKDLFQKVMPTVDKIRELKEQAKKSLSKE